MSTKLAPEIIDQYLDHARERLAEACDPSLPKETLRRLRLTEELIVQAKNTLTWSRYHRRHGDIDFADQMLDNAGLQLMQMQEYWETLPVKTRLFPADPTHLMG